MRYAPDLSWFGGGAPMPVRRPAGSALPAEREADAVAATVTGAPAAHRDGATGALATPYHGPALGTAQPLDPRDRALFERRLGVDLSRVRVHADDSAARAAESEGARAFTVGEDVVFGQGAYRPGTDSGRALLAHELTHVLQQRGGSSVVQRQDAQPAGPGRTPPPVPFTRAEGRGEEDSHLLYARDAADPAPADAALLTLRARTRLGPVRVDLHGYASAEGSPTYNLNLSAQRAYRLMLLIEPYLPPGSEVHLVAHGESQAFGAQHDPNRRVGIRFTPLPAGPLRPTRVPGLGERPPRPRLEVDPRLLEPPLIPGLLPGLGGVSPFTQLPPAVPPVTPSPFVPYRPPIPQPSPIPLHPSLIPLPSPGPPAVDWPSIRQSYQSRGVPMNDRDARAIEDAFQRAYQFFRRGLSHEQATAAARAATNSLVDRELGRENPNVHDRFAREWKEAYPGGWSTPIVPIPFLRWEF